ncbi:hypothetical protein SDC9_116947 [bioreactor metagenome]|jgi:hypothetical protein|uniref:DUF4945 domain-containing protein n=1 Tax=bioreactor metagenome TaxID=1076179 RepID=A0A645BX77_9ZZZZ
MKARIFIVLSLLFLFSACEYDIVDSKPGEPINTVSNLKHIISGQQITLTWDLPNSYPNDVIKPVSVFIRVTRTSKEKQSAEYPLYSPSALNAGTFTITNDPKSFIYDQYDPKYTYRFTVKIVGKVNVTSRNFSDTRYSSGAVIEIK